MNDNELLLNEIKGAIETDTDLQELLVSAVQKSITHLQRTGHPSATNTDAFRSVVFLGRARVHVLDNWYRKQEEHQEHLAKRRERYAARKKK